MKNKAKFKNLFIVVMLCFIVAVPIFSSSINVKADTKTIPIFDLEPAMFYIKYDYYDDWFLLIKKDIYEQYASNSKVCGYLRDLSYYNCKYLYYIFDYLTLEEGYAPSEWFNLIDFSLYENQYGYPSLKHYQSEYYLIPVSLVLMLDSGADYDVSRGSMSLDIFDDDYNCYMSINLLERYTIHNFYEKEIMPLVNSYNQGLTDGKASAFENYDKLVPTVLGSSLMFFTSIFGSINFFGISLLSIIGIVGGLFLLLFVLKVVRG